MRELNKLNVYKQAGKLFTKSLVKDYRGFEGRVVTRKGQQYREFDPSRSKLAAGIKKGLSQCGIKKGDHVLYLGASHGYTPSFVSDIVGENGFVYAVDFAPRVVRDLIFVCEERFNMAPLLRDANKPKTYEKDILRCDSLFMDVAQKNQVDIFLKNMKLVKKGGFGVLALKSRSVDIKKKPTTIFEETRKALLKVHSVVDQKNLYPWEKDHMLFIVKKK